jgi:predicted secreted protein
MAVVFAISLYIVIWWIVLFAMLPIGVRTQAEEGEVSPGTTESAPHLPMLLPKIVATTVVASLVFAALYMIIVHHVITLDQIPFLPRYESVR